MEAFQRALQDQPLLVQWYAWGAVGGCLASLALTLWVFFDARRNERRTTWAVLSAVGTALGGPALLVRLDGARALELSAALAPIAYLSMGGLALAFLAAFLHAADLPLGGGPAGNDFDPPFDDSRGRLWGTAAAAAVLALTTAGVLLVSSQARPSLPVVQLAASEPRQPVDGAPAASEPARPTGPPAGPGNAVAEPSEAPASTATPSAAEAWLETKARVDPLWRHNWYEAVRLIEGFNARYPGQPEALALYHSALLALAEWYFQEGQPNEGNATLQKAIELGLDSRDTPPASLAEIAPTALRAVPSFTPGPSLIAPRPVAPAPVAATPAPRPQVVSAQAAPSPSGLGGPLFTVDEILPAAPAPLGPGFQPAPAVSPGPQLELDASQLGLPNTAPPPGSSLEQALGTAGMAADTFRRSLASSGNPLGGEPPPSRAAPTATATPAAKPAGN